MYTYHWNNRTKSQLQPFLSCSKTLTLEPDSISENTAELSLRRENIVRHDTMMKALLSVPVPMLSIVLGALGNGFLATRSVHGNNCMIFESHPKVVDMSKNK